jgi:hypothetical protein
MNKRLHVCLVSNISEGDDDLNELTENLLGDLGSVAPTSKAVSDSPPVGAKAIDVALIGHLLITLTHSSGELVKIIDTIRDWLGRQSKRSVILQLGENRLELSNAAPEELQKLIQLWIEAIRRDSNPTQKIGEQ